MSAVTPYHVQEQGSSSYAEDKKAPVTPVAKRTPDSIISRQLSEMVEFDQLSLLRKSRSREGSPKPTRILPLKYSPSISSAEELNSLLQSCKRLAEISQETFFKPSFPEGNHANDVYMIYFEKDDGVPNIVFKPGLAVAERSKICYGLAQIISASNALVPSTEGTASIIASKDINKVYKKLYTTDHKLLLIDPKNLTEISPPEVQNNGQTICKISEQFFLLESDGAFVKHHPLSDIEAKMMSSNQFELLSANEKTAFYLVPSSKVYSINEHKETDYVQIDHVFYKLLEESDMGEIKLKFASVNLNTGKTADQKVIDASFTILDQEDPENKDCPYEVLVPCDAFIYIDEAIDKDDTISFNSEGKAFTASKSTIDEEFDEDDTVSKSTRVFYQITSSTEKKYQSSKLSLIVHNKEKTRFFLVPQDKQQEIIIEDEKEFVLRCGQKHLISEVENDCYQVIGRNVRGMVQKMVENIFTGPTKKPLDIRSPKLERDVFYKRINREHFIESFIMTILLRPQDGKVTDLSESNVLFPVINSSELGCVLIDLDETLPPNNNFSVHPDFKEKECTHIVRNGLMGFPQARSHLSKSEKSEAVRLIEKIISSRHEIESFLTTFVAKNDEEINFSQDHLKATLEVISLMESFLETNKKSNWTLEDLFFFVFPEYKQQWDILGTEPPELKAARIGLESQKELSKERTSSFRTSSFSEAE